MRDFAEEMRQKGKEKRSRQERIDKVMCKPGYTWNETVGRCLGPAGGVRDVDISDMAPIGNSQQSSNPQQARPPANPQQAIAKEVSARAMQG